MNWCGVVMQARRVCVGVRLDVLLVGGAASYMILNTNHMVIEMSVLDAQMKRCARLWPRALDSMQRRPAAPILRWRPSIDGRSLEELACQWPIDLTLRGTPAGGGLGSLPGPERERAVPGARWRSWKIAIRRKASATGQSPAAPSDPRPTARFGQLAVGADYERPG